MKRGFNVIRLCVMPLSEPADGGSAYEVLRPTISICVLTQALFPQLPGLHLDFGSREKAGLNLPDDLKLQECWK